MTVKGFQKSNGKVGLQEIIVDLLFDVWNLWCWWIIGVERCSMAIINESHKFEEKGSALKGRGRWWKAKGLEGGLNNGEESSA